MYRVKLTAKAKRELKKLSKEDKITVGEVIEEIKDNVFAGKSLSRELIGRFSYKSGAYRIIYKVNQQDKVVNVLSAGHRAIAYN